MNPVSNIRQTLRILWSDGRGIVLVTIATGWFFSLGVRMVYPVLLPHIRTTYGMDLSTAGLLLTALWLAYAIGQLPGGVLADRVGEGRIMMISSLVSVGMILLIVTAQSVFVLFVATILFGLTTALYGVARFTSLSHLYPKHDGAAIGMTMGAGDMGNTLLPPIAAFVATAFAWQYGLGMAVPMFALTAIGLWYFVPSKTSETTAVDSVSIETGRYILSEVMRPSMLVMATIQILVYCVWQALTGFYPTYLIEIKNFHPTTASAVFGFFFALGVVIKPLSGTAYDRFGAQKPLRAMLIALMAGLIALPLVDGFWGIVLVTIPLSGVLGYSAITLTFMTGGLPQDIQNTGLGTLRTTYMAVGALSPTFVGTLADWNYFDEAFFLLAGLTGIALVVSLRITADY
ncbi:MFS transporter [Natrinema sp. CBA1119]|uniref:MFS transporter n=1 Tax=Natrinema sp. CBA1119 TaxID=1608465 RepID=UPI0020D280DA|nr:MFS transporter [Natrinema sp. CBA1119]